MGLDLPEHLPQEFGGAGSGSGRPVVRNVVRRKPSKVRVRRLFLEEKKTGGTDSDGEPVPQDLVE